MPKMNREPWRINLLLRRAVAHLALAVLIFVAYATLVALFNTVLRDRNLTSSPWFALFFSLGLLLVVRPLRDVLQDAIDRLLFRIQFDYGEVVESLSRSLARTIDTREISQHVQQAVSRTVDPHHSHLIAQPLLDQEVDPVGSDPELRLDPATRSTLGEDEIVRASEIAGRPCVLPAGTELLVPLRFESELEGVLVLGAKKSGAPYSARDLEFLRILANQTATALRNAASYRRVTELLFSLESRVEERTRELKETQAELQASNEKLRHLDQLKTRLFSDASHELRTPLTLVLGPLSELRAQAALPPQGQRLLDLAYNNAAKLLVFTDTLLDLARLDAGRMQPSCRSEPLGPLIQRVAEPFRWLAEQRGIALRLHDLHRPYTAWCDAGMVSKIVGNLLANALKFTKAGSIDVSLDYAGARVAISVADTGPGIPAAELPYIFDRYRQASTATQSTVSGSGLGLALVKEFTELHNGTVEVHSTVGRGTRFVVWLPAYSPIGLDTREGLPEVEIPTVNLAALAASVGPPEPEPPRVRGDARQNLPVALVIDDNTSLLEFVQEVLASDYRVYCASNAERATAFLEQQRPDVILCDVMMPGQDGVAFCERLKSDELLRHIPLILVTARASLESKLHGLEAGADDYVTKPFHPEEIKARMAALLRMRKMEQELSRAYAQLQTAQQQLLQAEKMASLGTLVAGVAHEINNPVSFISSSIDLISRSIEELTEILDCHFEGHGRLDPKLQQLRQDLDYEYRLTTLKANASICRDGARRAAQIVRDLRTFCRPAPGRREEADLHESLDQALRLLHSEYKGHITIHREYGEIPRVLCDSGQMGQVFVNLLTNAIHAIKGHGEIHLRTSCENGYVSVEVQDNGTGMDEVTLSRIFDPFFTTKDVGKGTGLGLSIVRSLVSAHGGDITVRSRLGEGAVFRVTIPINGGQHEQQQ